MDRMLIFQLSLLHKLFQSTGFPSYQALLVLWVWIKAKPKWLVYIYTTWEVEVFDQTKYGDYHWHDTFVCLHADTELKKVRKCSTQSRRERYEININIQFLHINFHIYCIMPDCPRGEINSIPLAKSTFMKWDTKPVSACLSRTLTLAMYLMKKQKHLLIASTLAFNVFCQCVYGNEVNQVMGESDYKHLEILITM